MIINTHTHMMRFNVDFPRELGEFYASMFEGQNCWHTGEPWKPEDFCVPPEKLIADMDDAGIDKAVVLGVGYVTWGAHDPGFADYAQEMVSQYPNRLIGFYTADPIGGVKEVNLFQEAVHNKGMRGLKMLPSYNYVPLNDRRIWPLYEAAEGMGVPLLVHTGWSLLPKGKMLAYDHPLYLEDVMEDFPELKLIIGHTGFHWADEVIHFMHKFPHIYSDFAAWAETAPLWRVAQVWSWAKKLGVMRRFLWGTDYPYMSFATGQELFRKVADYTQRHELEPNVTQDDIDSFFGGAAAELLGFEQREPEPRPAHC